MAGSGDQKENTYLHSALNARWARIKNALRKILGLKPAMHQLSPLPQHSEHGIRIEKGDRVDVRNAQVSLRDLGESEVEKPPFPVSVPSWAADYQSGATFRLTKAIGDLRVNFDKNAVRLHRAGPTIEVALRKTNGDPLSVAYRIAEQALDAIAADSFLVSELDDPLREHASWSREGGATTLRYVTTARMAVDLALEIVVTTPDGEVRDQSQPTRKWHPSHAYFRRSQATNDLHEAYRNLFLAFEALLSTVFSWNPKIGERQWIQVALKYVCEGYGIDLSRYLSVQGRNPYRRFVREQYHARRCALFHAKLSEGPTIPGEFGSRAELLDATRLLGALYLDLSRRITGARFGGDALSYEAIAAMVKALADVQFYVAEGKECDFASIVTTPVEVTLGPKENPGLHWLKGRWTANTLPKGKLHRVGGVKIGNDVPSEALRTNAEINPDGVEFLEFIAQMEIVTSKTLRNWLM